MRFSSSSALALACGSIVLLSACSGGTGQTPAASAMSSGLRSREVDGVRNDILATARPPRRLAVTEFFNPSSGRPDLMAKKAREKSSSSLGVEGE